MSTRSAIIYHNPETNLYYGIYCHSDGYPEGVGNTLNIHYTDPKKIEMLVNLGHISSLGERVEPIGEHSFEDRERGTTVAYHRDRGESYDGPYSAPTWKEVAKRIDHAYSYVFENGAWVCERNF